VVEMKKERQDFQEKASGYRAEEYLKNSQNYQAISEQEKQLKEKKRLMEVGFPFEKVG
jgi:hypothetical protein